MFNIVYKENKIKTGSVKLFTALCLDLELENMPALRGGTGAMRLDTS